MDGATVQWFNEAPGPSASWTAGDQTVSAQFSGVDEDKARDLLGHLRYRDQPTPTGFEIDSSAELEPVTEIRQRGGAAPAVLVEWRDDRTQKTVTLNLVSTAPESYELVQFTRPGSPRTLGDREAVEQADGSLTWLEPPATSASLRLAGLDNAERDRLLASLQRSDNGALARLAQAVAAKQARQPLVAEASIASLRQVAGDLPGPQGGVVELRRPVDTDGAVLCLGLGQSPVCGAAEITSATGVDLTVDNPTTTWHVVIEIDGRLYLLGTTRATTTAVVVSAGDSRPLNPVLYEDPSGRRWYVAALPAGLTRALLQEQDTSGDSFGSGLLIPRLDGRDVRPVQKCRW